MTSSKEETGMRKELDDRDDEIRKLKAELSRRDEQIDRMRCQIEWMRVGIDQMQKPRTHRAIGISAEPSRKRSSTSVIGLMSNNNSGASSQLIISAIQDNAFLKHLDTRQREDLIKCMKSVIYKPGNVIMSEGEVGSIAYVIDAGVVEVFKDRAKVTELDSGKVFGELAVLYNCTRTATVKAKTDCKLWSLSRQDYQAVMTYSGLRQHKQYIKFLQCIPVIQKMQPESISKIADAVEEIHFHKGEYIIRQGAIGDTFYIITSGQVRVTQSRPNSDEEDVLCIRKTGEFFGERALETEDVRAANVIADDANGVDCLVLDSNAYKRLLKGKGLYAESKERTGSITSANKSRDPTGKFASATLNDLDIKTTLGIGGFGRVELVQLKNDKSAAYALKRLKKQYLVDMGQQDHVMQEKQLLMQIDCPFIIKLHRTFKDAKYLYLLMDVCLGGELWTIMRNRHFFTEKEGRFFIACVIKAFDYLHRLGIVYRDLKPENLMLDERGYVKMVDFGFAKRLSHTGHKTWTFCGTPEYVAPEIILNKGHDYAADLWSLGILVYELLNGSPPFSGNDHMNTYNMILRGIQSIDFSKRVAKNAKNIVKKLCKDNPNDRLGYGSKGLDNLQKHKWFDGFDWNGLAEGKLKAPIVPVLNGKTDTSNFDQYPADDTVTPDELSGWDKDF